MQTDNRPHHSFGEESTQLSQLGQRAGFGGKEGVVCPLITTFDRIAVVLEETSREQVLWQSFVFLYAEGH